MSAPRWTPAETAELERRVLDGQSDEEIAAGMVRTKNAVRCRRARMGLDSAIPRGRKRQYCWQTIGALLDEGHSRAEVARRLGMRADTVRSIAASIAA